MNRLVESLHSGRVLVMDGAMGTELQRLGLRDDECSAMWNITHPEQVAAVHRAYLEAGAEALLTNTFTATRAEQWQAALDIATIFRDTVPLVLADVGPGGDWPTLDNVSRADGILLETWSFETGGWAAPDIPHTAGEYGVPLMLSFTFRHHANGSEPRTLDGASPADCLLSALSTPLVAIGANCGRDVDMDDLLEIIRVYRDHTDLPIFIRPNAGTPARTPNGWQYPRSPQYMADRLWPLLEAGVTMVGGCCGTTPAHIAAFRRVVDEWNAQHAPGR